MELTFYCEPDSNEWRVLEPGKEFATFRAKFTDNYAGNGIRVQTSIGGDGAGAKMWGELKVLVYGNGQINGQRDVAKIVCSENRSFEMPLSHFYIDDEYLLGNGLLSDSVSFALPASNAKGLGNISSVFFKYWQIKILGPLIESDKRSAAYASGLIFRKRNGDDFFLACNRLREPAQVKWVSEIPEPIFSNEYGDVYVYDDISRQDKLTISTDDFFKASVQ